MNYIDIENKIRNIVALQINKDVEEINPESNLEVLGVDSLDLTEIILMIEEEFEYNFNLLNEEYERLKTVKNIVNLVSYKISSGIFDRYTKKGYTIWKCPNCGLNFRKEF